MTRLDLTDVPFTFHPEVWTLIVGLGALYLYATGPLERAAAPVDPTSRANKRWFAIGLFLLWIAADWPMHDVGEDYLYVVHMVQHTILTLVVPPVLLLATPTWLARTLLAPGTRGEGFARTLARPMVAGAVFNLLVLASHWSSVVNASVDNGLLHYAIHSALMVSALALWIPICGPIPEWRISPPGQMALLFLTSIIPTVPAAWLTFADGVLYRAYDTPGRLLGLSATTDQQAAGLVMKLFAGSYLWLVIIVIFFRWAMHRDSDPGPFRAPLTYEQVADAFDRAPSHHQSSGRSPLASDSAGSERLTN